MQFIMPEAVTERHSPQTPRYAGGHGFLSPPTAQGREAPTFSDTSENT
jgi:hypothetical protein